MLVAVAMPGFAGHQYPDVPTDHPFHSEIGFVTDEGIMEGFGDGEFKTTRDVTRQAMVAFLYRLDGEPAGPHADPGFDDVDADHPFYDEIAWAVEDGVAQGYGDNTFRPTNPVTRQATASFMWSYAGEPDAEGGGEQFSDVNEGHTFYDAIRWMADAQITEGFADGEFKTTRGTSRQAMAAFVQRFMAWLDEQVDPEFGDVSGTVTDSGTNDPIEGATITLDGETATTGADGTFAIDDVETGTYTATASAEGYEDASEDVTVEADTTTTVDFALTEAVAPEFGDVAGTVTDGDTEDPIEGATITLNGETATTGADGTFAIDDVEVGEYTITASADGYAEASETVTVEADETAIVDFALVAADPGDGLFEPGDFTMFVESGSVIIGTDEDEPYVIDFTECPGGEPAEEDAECITLSGVIDEDGNFTIEPDGVFFPELSTEEPLPLTARTGVSGDVTGSIDPDTGEATFNMPMQVDIDLFQNGEGDCRIVIDMDGTTGSSGGLTGSPLADSQATFVDGLFDVPATTSLGGTYSGLCPQVDDAVGVPSPSGENTAVLNLLLVQ